MHHRDHSINTRSEYGRILHQSGKPYGGIVNSLSSLYLMCTVQGHT